MPGKNISTNKKALTVKTTTDAALLADYLARPYARQIVRDEDGTYLAEVVEFEGCFATGATGAEALSALEEVTKEWLALAIANKRDIPDPLEENEFSGRLVLRMSKGLHRRAARLAEAEGVSLNQYIVTSLSMYIGGAIGITAQNRLIVEQRPYSLVQANNIHNLALNLFGPTLPVSALGNGTILTIGSETNG